MEEKKEGGTILELIISIFLGIFPSFLLFSMFNQSNFSPLRYWNFLLDINSSWISWLSIIFIAIIVYFLMNKIQSKKKKAFALFFILFLLLAFIIGYLYANFLLGNDILVKLSADKENVFFGNSTNQTVTLTMSAIMNPFCIAQCEYSLLDISTGEIIEIGGFGLNSILSKSQEYTFSREGKMQGQALNRFEISCKSQKSKLCYTLGEESKRTILITLNYDFSPEQKIANEISKRELISSGKTIYNLSEKINELNLRINLLDNFIFTEELSLKSMTLSYTLINLNASFENLKQTWMSQDYSRFEQEFPSLKNEIDNLSMQENELLSLVISNTFYCNEMIQVLHDSKNKLKEISLGNISETSCINLTNTIVKFNKAVKNFKEKSNLSYKETIVNDISSEVDNLYKDTKKQNGSLCFLTINISEEIPAQINITPKNYTPPEIYLKEPTPICCLYGKCEKCCDETCSNIYYPILFLHGHSFNKDTSADYSLDAFGRIKEKLREEGYIDAGAVIISQSSEQNGLWGKVNAPIEVTGSYFFDISKSETGQETIVPSKTDNIDTYSLRLNDLIDTVKARTGKDKVIVVAHSMGGLVTRRYIQIFGEKNDIEKIIFITVPNHGIEGNIKNYCPLIGSQVECNDMNKDSLLMNKLNNAPNISIPIYNVIGIGCSMDGEQGDGVVKESSQYLSYADNFYVEGICNEREFKFLHETILNPEKYPQTYEFILEKLKN